MLYWQFRISITHLTLNWNFGYLLILDVRNVLKICSVEKPCEVNAGDCSIDNECRGNLICTRDNCEGPRLSLYAKCCQEPGNDMFYIIIYFTNYYKIVNIFFYSSLLCIFPKKPFKVSWIFFFHQVSKHQRLATSIHLKFLLS